MRYKALDGLRGVCALGVALNHLWVTGHFRQSPIVNNFHLFVDFFFVLSGFVISHAYRHTLNDRVDGESYLIRRFGRIYPLHFVTLAVLTLYEIAKIPLHQAFVGRSTIDSIPGNLLLLQGLGIFSAGTWNSPSWSISVEFALYIIFGMISIFVALKIRLLIYLAMVGIGFFLIFYSPRIMDSTTDFGLARGLYGFFLGCLVNDFENWGGKFSRASGHVLELGITTLILGFLYFVDRGRWSMLATPLFAVAVHIFSKEAGIVSDALRGTISDRLGRWSYSIYLWHFAMISLLFGVLKLLADKTNLYRIDMIVRAADGEAFQTIDFGNPWIGDAFAFAFLIAVLIISNISYRIVEVPGRNFFGRIAKRHTQARRSSS